jgi:hypothetical protein
MPHDIVAVLHPYTGQYIVVGVGTASRSSSTSSPKVYFPPSLSLSVRAFGSRSTSILRV